MSLTFTMDDVREHCSPPTNGWLPGADSIKMADEIDNLRREVDHLQRESADAVAAIARVRAVLADPPVPSRMLIPVIREALDGAE